jgi:hypothetical protein
MKTKILSTIALVAMIWGGGAVRYSPAQTRSENDLYNRTPIGTKVSFWLRRITLPPPLELLLRSSDNVIIRTYLKIVSCCRSAIKAE